MDKTIRKDLSNGLRDAVSFAEDASDAGGMLLEQGTEATVKAATGLFSGIVGIPASLVRKIADAVDDNTDE